MAQAHRVDYMANAFIWLMRLIHVGQNKFVHRFMAGDLLILKLKFWCMH